MYSNDIVFLNFENFVVFGVGVGFVCLLDIGNIFFVDLNKICWIIGWGDLYLGGY